VCVCLRVYFSCSYLRLLMALCFTYSALQISCFLGSLDTLCKLLFSWLLSLCDSESPTSPQEVGTIETKVVEKHDHFGPTCALPGDIFGRIACLSGFQAVGKLGACSKMLQGQVWDSQDVWLALTSGAGLSADCLGRPYYSRPVALQAREIFRRCCFRTDLSRLRSLAAAGRTPPILTEAAHVACGLLPGDLSPSGMDDFIKIASRAIGAHDPESPRAVSTAKCLMRAARRCMELFTEEQLEHLDYAFQNVHQLHALMVSSMERSHESMLEASFWSDPSKHVEVQQFKN